MSSTTLGRLLAVAATLSVALSAAAPASADDAARAAAERRASISLVGHGFGHGHGLSQYGAHQQARLGRTYRQILGFYYPGLTRGRAGGQVRMQITADTDDALVILDRSRLKAKSLKSGRSVALRRAGATRWRITPARGGRASAVAYRARGGWRTLRVLPGAAQVSAGGQPVTLVTKGGRTAYRGALRSVGRTATSKKRDTVNVVPLEQYLRGVVPQEVPALWPRQAVMAQAVAARTYAAFERRRPLAPHFQICDTSQCQVYGGFSAEHPASNAAIDATRGEALLSGGQPAFTQFSASNGGWAAAGSFAYLPAKHDPYDRWAGNPYNDWRATISGAAIQRAFPSIGTFQSITVTRRDGRGQWGGRVLEVRITGSRAAGTVSGETFRSIFGLRSTYFTA